ncbi:hypothetical protein A3A09_03700 [Candidatus Nomurabacteria bacterium RIFCSPLOWO2_01_FULL_42_20]|uniref:Uncharacterized protein n=1 Tax=Candidatus Nomurabacteria bacterium RIFCSPHIGHO2_01_FULL_42_16 TaxID=1801743 RepID=A0A1F6VI16_9BACT|nr:MAG: hypothetical protein A2824_00865 [Candidatus Nomurabacteria bacterium RIFCSPHIGHO2_01_FULL_42_16]OGI91411.1 MAG: hypothetical protein A3A09_03700 [Candidatus Nomurabacteria bacterium RIFCSPLOWO2_01_FULL_42_20]
MTIHFRYYIIQTEHSQQKLKIMLLATEIWSAVEVYFILVSTIIIGLLIAMICKLLPPGDQPKPKGR